MKSKSAHVDLHFTYRGNILKSKSKEYIGAELAAPVPYGDRKLPEVSTW